MDEGLKLVICLEPFGKRTIPLRHRLLTVGRAGDQDICIPDRKISSAHAVLEPVDTGYQVRDLSSTNGTYVNGDLVDGIKPLALGDEIRFGNTLVLFTDKSIDELANWPGAGAYTKVEDEPEDIGLKTVKFKLPDVERNLLSSDDGALGSVRLQRKLQILYRMTMAARGHVANPRGLMDEALLLVFDVIDADRGAFFLSVRASDPGGPTGTAPAPNTRELEEVASRSRSGRAPGAARISLSMLQQVLESGEAILSRDVLHDQRFDANHSIFRTNIRSALAVPLRGQDEVLGVLHLDKRDSRRPFGEEDLHLAVIVAQQVAATLHNARLFEAVTRANRDLETARDEILRWNQDLEQKVADRTKQVADLSRQKDQLLGMVAHDLRTPLAGLLGFAEVAIAGIDMGIEPSKTREDLDIIRTTALEMSELLNDLLDVARIESGKMSVDPRDIDLAKLVRAASKRYERWAEQKQIAFRMRVPKGVLRVSADPKRIQQVLNNLVSNAIKFSNPGAKITLAVTREARRVLVSVADTGQGIESSDLGKVFASYEQASARATAGEHGSGLGLSIAKKLIEHHGGEIWVDSKPGVGSKFTFSLPCE